MNKFQFKRQLADLTHRVEVEGKTNPSWLMGYLQGLGNDKLTGYQCAILIDMLLVPLEELGKKNVVVEAATSKKEEEPIVHTPEEEPEKGSVSLIQTLAQR